MGKIILSAFADEYDHNPHTHAAFLANNGVGYIEPRFVNGQIVWVQQCDHIGIGEVGIFIYDGEGYIKVYDEQEPTGDDLEEYTDSYGVVHMQPVMHSFNKKYEPRVISAHAGFEIVGRVL